MPTGIEIALVRDFFDNPEAVRKKALRQEYAPHTHLGDTYHGIGKTLPMWYRAATPIRQALGFIPVEVASFWRLGLEGEDVTSFIHSDFRMESDWAAVCYMHNPVPFLNGTAFWRLRKSGELVAPVERILEQEAQGDFSLGMALGAMGNAEDLEEHWVLDSVVGSHFNSCVLYRSNRYHSRFPRSSWGSDASNGRLVWVAFFNEGEHDCQDELESETRRATAASK